MYGAYDYFLGRSLNEVITRHEPVLREHFKNELDLDIKQILLDNPASILAFDDKLTAPTWGFADRADYYYKASCVHRIPEIKVPTLFMNALDDPVVSRNCIDFEVFKQNENTVLATTMHGGHLGYHESMFSLQQWFMNPVLDFFDAL